MDIEFVDSNDGYRLMYDWWKVLHDEHEQQKLTEEQRYMPSLDSVTTDEQGRLVQNWTIPLMPGETPEDYIQYLLDNGFTIMTDEEK